MRNFRTGKITRDPLVQVHQPQRIERQSLRKGLRRLRRADGYVRKNWLGPRWTKTLAILFEGDIIAEIMGANEIWRQAKFDN
jgi:hypothetical protein